MAFEVTDTYFREWADSYSNDKASTKYNKLIAALIKDISQRPWRKHVAFYEMSGSHTNTLSFYVFIHPGRIKESITPQTLSLLGFPHVWINTRLSTKVERSMSGWDQDSLIAQTGEILYDQSVSEIVQRIAAMVRERYSD